MCCSAEIALVYGTFATSCCRRINLDLLAVKWTLNKFSKSAHESARGTPPQPLQSQNIAQMIVSIFFSSSC